jgi:hypothetical protein
MNGGSSGSDAGTLEDRLRAVERITVLFRAERLVYLGFAITAFALLVICILIALLKGAQASSLLGAFGSSGVVAYTSGRVIVMWNRALSIVAAERSDDNG